MSAVDHAFHGELQQAVREVALADIALEDDLARFRTHAGRIGSYSGPISVVGGVVAYRLVRRAFRQRPRMSAMTATTPAKAGLAALALRLALPAVAGFARERVEGWQGMGSTPDRSGFAGPGAAAPRQARALPRVSADLDRARFSGLWFEVARLEEIGFRPDVDALSAPEETTLVFVPVPGGFDVERCTATRGADRASRLDIRSGVLRPTDRAGHGSELSISWAPSWLQWAPMAWNDYWVLEIDTEYSFALVGNRARTTLTVLSRTPALDEQAWGKLLHTAADEGYPVDRLVRTRAAS